LLEHIYDFITARTMILLKGRYERILKQQEFSENFKNFIYENI
jgi:hypothetical protein